MSILQKIIKMFEEVPIKLGISFFLLNSLFVFFISSKYVELLPPVLCENQSLYLVMSLFSHFFLLSFLPFFLVYLPLVLARVNPKVVCAVTSFVVTLGLVLLAVDAYIFSLYRFHINCYVIEQVLGPDAGQVFEFSSMQYLMFLMLFVVFYVAEIFLFKTTIKLSLRFRGTLLIFVPIFWILSFLFVFTYRTISLSRGEKEIEAIERHYPMCISFDTNSMLDLFFDDIPKTKVEVDVLNKKYRYPKRPLRTTTCKKNLLIIAFDSWRASTMDSICSPEIYKFSRKSSCFATHYSGSNGTRSGVFSMFYGLPGAYFRDFKEQSISSVFLEELKNQKYDIKLFPSASLRNPPLDKTVFLDYPDQCFSAQGTSAWSRDKSVQESFYNYLATRAVTDTVPFFAFLFFDSLHSMIMPQDYNPPFHPTWRYAQYEKLGMDVDPTEFYNLYKNMVYYLDKIVGEILKELKENGLMENTIIIITGDHSQEFDDNRCGYWGHNGNYSRAQLHVPFIYYDAEKSPKLYSHWSSHYDIVPTLMEEMFSIENPASDYSIGFNLFDEEERKELLVDSYIGLGWIDSSGSIMNLHYDGTFQYLDSTLKEDFSRRLDKNIYEKIMSSLGTFYE